MKKIVFLRTNPKATGGAERYLSRLKNSLNSQGIASQIYAFKGSQKISSWLKAIKFNKQVCRDKKEDEFYFSLERVTCADIYRAGDGVHKVYRTLKPFWFFNPLNFVYVYLEKKCFKNAKHIIANSNFIKEQIINTYNIDEKKITTVYNGINLPNFVKKGEAKLNLCSRLGLNLELPIILFLGSGFKRKGVVEFLQIVSKLNTKVNAIIVGTDKNIDNYKKLSKQLGVNVVFTGKIKITNEYYEASDIFLFPTKYEPFSNVVLEALSYGCVVFTTKQNGANEILDSKFVMENSKDFSVVEKIDNLLNNPLGLIEEQSKAIEISKKFTIEKNAKETLEIINEYIH